MSREKLHFEELRIRRMRGFEDGGFTLSGLSPGINLVHGPNGSGKSTAALVIGRLLWPSSLEGDRVSIAGRFRLGDAEWRVDVDGSRVSYQCNGVDESGPVLPSADDRRRYRLSLHDLLHERDGDFARTIVRESAGGYDIRAAGAVLGPRELPKRRIPANDELSRARQEYEATVAAQRELQEAELGLRDLRRQKSAAEASLERVRVLEAALEHANAREQEAYARDELERFPSGLERVVGTEYERLCQLRTRLEAIDTAAATAREAAATARSDIDASRLPDAALGEEVLRALEQDLTDLREAEQETSRAVRAGAAAAARLEDERTRIAGAVDPDRLATLGEVAVGNLAAFARRAGQLDADRQALESQLRMLGEAVAGEDPGRLDDGIRILRRWLRQPAATLVTAGGTSAYRAGAAAAALLIVLGVALAILSHPLYLIVGVLGAALLWPMARRSPSPAAGDARDVHRAEYLKLALDSPDSWEPAAVEAVLERLQERQAGVQAAAESARRRRELEEQLRALAAEGERLEAERQALASRLGVEPERSATALVWLAEAMGRWQAAHADMAGQERARRVAEEQAAALAKSLRDRLVAFGFESLSTTGELTGAIHALGARRQTIELARQALSGAVREEQRLREEREEREAEMVSIFDGLGLDPDSDQTVQDWCELHADYRRARDAQRDAATTLRAAQARLLARHGDDSLAAAPLSELEAAIDAEREQASRRDALADVISRTEERVQEAKRSHGIEEAVERIQRAEEALRQARERDTRGVIARELIDHVEQATRDQQLPAVFGRARELLTRITHGRYELRLRSDGEPEFSAFDTVERRGRGLDELSSGTRVQLLIAVRVAFVEQQEQAVRLPLILDEVLGNSDDERAWAIMEATVELAREGRQIFYFTAQSDEVARWRSLAATTPAGMELREIDLLQLRGMERALAIPATVPSVRRPLPAPDGVDHVEYGRRLEVPRLDRAMGDADSVHLWYLVEEPEELHRLLLLGPDRWGALDSLLRDGGRPLVEERLQEQLQLSSRALEAFFQAARIGIGLRVNRAVLEESGAVSATFLDRVDRLAGEVEGDGIRLMEALEAGAVSRFGQASKERLRAYLEEGGYCPQEASLDLVEIRVRVLSRVAAEITAGKITVAELDRLLGRLWLGIGGS